MKRLLIAGYGDIARRRRLPALPTPAPRTCCARSNEGGFYQPASSTSAPAVSTAIAVARWWMNPARRIHAAPAPGAAWTPKSGLHVGAARAEAAGRIAPELLSFMDESRRLDNSRLKHTLGVRLRYPTVREGLMHGHPAGIDQPA